MDMRRVHAPVVIASLFFSNMAHAQSTATALKQFGLFGTWANDCSQAAAPTNEYAIFSLTSIGTVQLRNDFGPYYDTMVYRIIDARRIGAGLLSMRQLLVSDNQIRVDMVLMRMNPRFASCRREGPMAPPLLRTEKCPRPTGSRPAGWCAAQASGPGQRHALSRLHGNRLAHSSRARD
jgi:hypothetical protein